MPTHKLYDGKHRMGRCPIHGDVSLPHRNCKWSPAEPWAMEKQVPDSVLMQATIKWLKSLNGPIEKKLARDFFEKDVEQYEATERGRALLELVRAHT